MIISHIKLKNWRNFRKVDIDLTERVFMVGPNASGKSNFLDVFKFLRDIAKPQGGGLQQAVKDRGGVSKIRCLAARQESEIEIEVHLAEAHLKPSIWIYAISLKQEPRGARKPYIAYEKVWHKDKLILNRPDEKDEKDEERKTETHLEQINANQEFREINKFFNSVFYLHLIPQLLRHPESFSGPALPGDPFGRNFMEKVANTQERTRKARLKKIEEALKIAVPQFSQLNYIKDSTGVPHFEVRYENWRAKGAKQREDQFSDGTLRLIGLLWSLLESDTLLLLEEPEMSLNSGIVNKLPGIFHRMQKQKKRQIIISTHSDDLLSGGSIGGEEILLLKPIGEGTKIEVASSITDIKKLLETGLSMVEAIKPHTQPQNIEQLQFQFTNET
jgi:predicted ATPase